MPNKDKTKKKKKELHIPIKAIFCGLVFFVELILVILLAYFAITINAVGDYIYVPTILLLIIDFILGIFILNTKVQVDFKVSWVIVVLIFPFAGAILYILFANKITTKKKKELRFSKLNKFLSSTKCDSTDVINEIKVNNEDVANIVTYIDKSCLASVHKNSEVKYYNYGQKGFPVILDELKKAKKFIFLEYFIISNGIMFGSILDILKEKAKEGLDVRIIYDDFGSNKGKMPNIFKEATKNGIKCLSFNRVRPVLDIRQNNRDHRKIIVIDGVVGFTGGCNLADEYINEEVRFGDWRDNICLVKGEAVDGLTSLFVSTWNLLYKRKNKEEPLDFNIHSFKENNEELHTKVNCSGYVSIFGEVPFDGEDGAKSVILSMISKAKKSIKISTPYLILDSELTTALCVAAKSGIDVSIVTPGIPDKKIVNFMTKSYYPALMFAGCKIYEYTPGFNHAKIVLIDDEYALTGTTNLDYRSLYLHFENCIFLYQNECIKDIKNDLDDMITSSTLQDKNKYINASGFKRIIWGLLRLIAPLI